MKTTTKPFKVYLPGNAKHAPRYIGTIEVEVETSSGEEFLTQESRQRIERLRARHMGLLTGDEIKAMRQRMNLSQKELTELLDCGDKSLSRWENGHGFPTGIVNKLLRLLDEGFLSPEDLKLVVGPRTDRNWANQFDYAKARRKPLHYCKSKRSKEKTSGTNIIPFAA